MTKVIEIFKEAVSQKRLLSAVLGGAATVVLSSVNVKTALLVSVAVLLMLTFSTAISSLLHKITGKEGVTAVYFTLCAAVAMASATVFTHFDIFSSDSVAKIMVLTVGSSLVIGRVPEVDAPLGEAVIDAAVTGGVLAVIAVPVAVIRELLAFGTLMGLPVADASLPIAAKPAFGLMMLGIIAVLINVTPVIVRTLRNVTAKKEKEVSDKDE